jgi:hypothetical protein
MRLASIVRDATALLVCLALLAGCGGQQARQVAQQAQRAARLAAQSADDARRAQQAAQAASSADEIARQLRLADEARQQATMHSDEVQRLLRSIDDPRVRTDLSDELQDAQRAAAQAEEDRRQIALLFEIAQQRAGRALAAETDTLLARLQERLTLDETQKLYESGGKEVLIRSLCRVLISTQVQGLPPSQFDVEEIVQREILAVGLEFVDLPEVVAVIAQALIDRALEATADEQERLVNECSDELSR